MVLFAVVFVAALGSTPLLDYVWHAWMGHGPRGMPTRASHLEHHRTAHTAGDPWAEIRENLVGVVLAAFACGAVGALVLGVAGGAAVASGLFLGYVAITVSHARMHRRAPRTPFEHWFWRFHFHHHYGDPNVNFGLTSPIFDYVFRTAHVPDLVEIPAAVLPAWWEGEGKHPGFAVRRRSA